MAWVRMFVCDRCLRGGAGYVPATWVYWDDGGWQGHCCDAHKAEAIEGLTDPAPQKLSGRGGGDQEYPVRSGRADGKKEVLEAP